MPEFRSPVETLAEGMAFIRRHRSIISLTCLVTLVVALLRLVTTVPMFTAKAELVIDSKAPGGDAASVSTIVESQIAIIKSEGIARAVIQKLSLGKDPEFAAQGVVSRMASATSQLLGWRKPETDSSVSRHAIEVFERKLSVKRVGVTYILEMTFDSVDPERAAHILSTVAETYITAQMDEKYKWSPQSEKWFKERTNELSNQASAAKKAVTDFYNRTDIADSSGAVDAGTPPSQLTPSMQAELHELQATAETATRTYDNFLRAQRYMEITQQQSSPAFEARLLSDVSRPLVASSPKARILLGISAVGGLLLGIAVGMLRDLLDRGIFTSRDRTTMSSVVALQQGEAALASENYAPTALSPLRHQNPREEPGALATHAGSRRGPDA